MRTAKIVVIGLVWLTATAVAAVFSADAAHMLPVALTGWMPPQVADALAWTWKGLAIAPLPALAAIAIVRRWRRRRETIAAAEAPTIDLARPGADVERPMAPKPPAVYVAHRDMLMDEFVGP